MFQRLSRGSFRLKQDIMLRAPCKPLVLSLSGAVSRIAALLQQPFVRLIRLLDILWTGAALQWLAIRCTQIFWVVLAPEFVLSWLHPLGF
jgi:hypothetical protein